MNIEKSIREKQDYNLRLGGTEVIIEDRNLEFEGEMILSQGEKIVFRNCRFSVRPGRDCIILAPDCILTFDRCKFAGEESCESEEIAAGSFIADNSDHSDFSFTSISLKDCTVEGIESFVITDANVSIEKTQFNCNGERVLRSRSMRTANEKGRGIYTIKARRGRLKFCRFSGAVQVDCELIRDCRFTDCGRIGLRWENR